LDFKSRLAGFGGKKGRGEKEVTEKTKVNKEI